MDELDHSIERGRAALLNAQRADGHFSFEFEADATIPAEYVLLTHYLGETPDMALEAKIARYLRRIQNDEGGWPLFHLGAFDMSASVKAYFALKMIGDDPAAPHMAKARQAILSHGGAERSNVFTRFLLALYGIVGWQAVPVMPVEVMLLPRWFPFHMSKISYWARTTLAPMLVLQALKPRARNPRGVGLNELFLSDPQQLGPITRAPHQDPRWFRFFAFIDAGLRRLELFFPKRLRQRAIDRTVAYLKTRLNGEHGVGAIFPPMVGMVMMFDALGVPAHDPSRAAARQALDKLLLIKDDEAYCQPCFSPVWDTALAAHSLLEAGDEAHAQVALRWLLPRQILECKGDWAVVRPDVRPGGWPFQYANDYYPDLDDTAVVVMALHRAHAPEFQNAIERGAEWILGLQSKNGGWASFDADNTASYLNHIPFSDHGALLDPPTSDVTARCISMLAQLGHNMQNSAALRRGVEFLLGEQEEDGSWFGRWGINYIYGTWSALCALQAAGFAPHSVPVAKAVAWLITIQNADGGWGEDGASYKLDYTGYEPFPSLPSQTAWALLGLMAAGQAAHPAVQRGIAYLEQTQLPQGGWRDAYHNAPGFPRIFYLRYHGYASYFPLWALARYRRLRQGDNTVYGM